MSQTPSLTEMQTNQRKQQILINRSNTLFQEVHNCITVDRVTMKLQDVVNDAFQPSGRTVSIIRYAQMSLGGIVVDREIKALLLVDRKTCQSPTSQRAHGQVLSRHLRDCGLGHYIVSEQLEAEPRHLKLCVEGLPFRLDLDPQVLVGPDEIKKVFADFVAAIPLWITACNAFNTRNSFIDPLLVSAMVALFLIDHLSVCKDVYFTSELLVLFLAFADKCDFPSHLPSLCRPTDPQVISVSAYLLESASLVSELAWQAVQDAVRRWCEGFGDPSSAVVSVIEMTTLCDAAIKLRKTLKSITEEHISRISSTFPSASSPASPSASPPASLLTRKKRQRDSNDSIEQFSNIIESGTNASHVSMKKPRTSYRSTRTPIRRASSVPLNLDLAEECSRIADEEEEKGLVFDSPMSGAARSFVTDDLNTPRFSADLGLTRLNLNESERERGFGKRDILDRTLVGSLHNTGRLVDNILVENEDGEMDGWGQQENVVGLSAQMRVGGTQGRVAQPEISVPSSSGPSAAHAPRNAGPSHVPVLVRVRHTGKTTTNTTSRPLVAPMENLSRRSTYNISNVSSTEKEARMPSKGMAKRYQNM